MDEPNEAKLETSTDQPVFDRAYRINELNKIEQKIARLLRCAGEAMQALTLQQSTATESSQASSQNQDAIEQRKERFSKAASEYFAALSYVDVHLRREIYALEEANIIPVDIPKEVNASSQPDGVRSVSGSASGSTAASVSGGTGNLDIGWLNSRNDKVGKDMQAELWSQAKELLDGVHLNELFGRTTIEETTLLNGSGE